MPLKHLDLSYAGTTIINPLGFIILLLCSIALLVTDRRNAFWPIMIMVFFVSQAQRIVIFTLDFNQMRIMAFVGLARILLKGELQNLKRHKLDYFIIGYALVGAFAHIVRDGSGAIVNELGQVVEEKGSSIILTVHFSLKAFSHAKAYTNRT